MSHRNIVNVPASIRAKLLNKSREFKRPFLELLQYYAIERFLYRLSISDHSHKFFLKGALMFRVWRTMEHRATLDIDLLGKTRNSIENLEKICQEICEENTALEDGMIFFSNTVKGEVIQTDAEYEGVRIGFIGELNKAMITMQIDIGFGDIISPKPQLMSYPTILDLPAPQLESYTIESVIAEKLETMVKRGISNSRMKDFFDVWTLSKQFPFNGKILAEAVRATFHHRQTPLEPTPECFSSAFVTNPTKKAQWESFVLKNRLSLAPDSLEIAINQISQFLSPILESAVSNEPSELTWNPPHAWEKE